MSDFVLDEEERQRINDELIDKLIDAILKLKKVPGWL